MRTLNSKITTVTVFKDRAEVTRQAHIEKLTPGEYALAFDKLPKQIDQNSIQVNGIGKAILSNVKFEVVNYTEKPKKNQRAIEEELQSIRDELRKLDDQTARLKKEIAFMEGMSKKVISPTDGEPNLGLDPSKWEEILNYYNQKLTKADEQLFEIEKSKCDWEAKLEDAQYALLQVDKVKHFSKNRVTVWVEVTEETELLLELSYMMGKASWRPIYDLRVSSEDKQMNITYNAHIKQNTGENWEDAQLILSTAQPQISGDLPELSPWRIHLYNDDPEYSSALLMGSGVAVKQDPKVAAKLAQIDPAIAVQKPKAIVETGVTSVTFEIVGKHTVKSDNNDHLVTIMMEDLPAHFRYFTVPKLSKYAYLKVKVRNETDYPWLAGRTNIFLDNNFVGNASLNNVSPNEEFWTSLGIDQSFKIEYNFLRMYESKEGGLFSKKTKNITYEYQINIKNNKLQQEEIFVKDQLPITQNKELKVHLLEPASQEEQETPLKDEYEFLEWSFKPQAGEELKIPFKFAIEYPREREVVGLN